MKSSLKKANTTGENGTRLIDAVGNFPNLRLVAVLMNSPAWARSQQSSDDRTTPPANPNDFAHFASEFANRYGNSIDHYQVWDEPNLTATWGGLEPRPVEYAAILRETYSAIHSVDSSAIVIAGAIAPTTETGPKNIQRYPLFTRSVCPRYSTIHGCRRRKTLWFRFIAR